jgi:hypothetical protein
VVLAGVGAVEVEVEEDGVDLKSGAGAWFVGDGNTIDFPGSFFNGVCNVSVDFRSILKVYSKDLA